MGRQGGPPHCQGSSSSLQTSSSHSHHLAPIAACHCSRHIAPSRPPGSCCSHLYCTHTMHLAHNPRPPRQQEPRHTCLLPEATLASLRWIAKLAEEPQSGTADGHLQGCTSGRPARCSGMQHTGRPSGGGEAGTGKTAEAQVAVAVAVAGAVAVAVLLSSPQQKPSPAQLLSVFMRELSTQSPAGMTSKAAATWERLSAGHITASGYRNNMAAAGAEECTAVLRSRQCIKSSHADK